MPQKVGWHYDMSCELDALSREQEGYAHSIRIFEYSSECSPNPRIYSIDYVDKTFQWMKDIRSNTFIHCMFSSMYCKKLLQWLEYCTPKILD